MVGLDKDVIENLFNKLKEFDLSDRQKKYVKLLESKFQELITHAKLDDSELYDKLTPTEIKVVDLIIIGYTSKEIANLMNISTRTVAVHRNSIRKKLGITNKKVNLRNYLSSK